MKQKFFILFILSLLGYVSGFAQKTIDPNDFFKGGYKYVRINNILYRIDNDSSASVSDWRTGLDTDDDDHDYNDSTYWRNAVHKDIVDRELYEPKGDIVIPEFIEYGNKTYRVDSINECAFCNCAELTSVSLPNCIKTIREYAFTDDWSLKTINFPAKLRRIEHAAFDFCLSLKIPSIFPDSLQYIGPEAFLDCVIPDSMIMPNKLTELEDRAFFGSQLTMENKSPLNLCMYILARI